MTGRAVRWQRNTSDEFITGSLNENMERVRELDAVPDERYRKDVEILNGIRDAISNNL